MIDLQVNGCFGIDFNSDELTVAELSAACSRLQRAGVSQILATIITDELELMEGRLRRIAEFRRRDNLVESVVVGIHVEGPSISPLPGFVGAHPAECVRAASVPLMERIVTAGAGLVRMLTLAPECDPDAQAIRWLVKQGVVVSAGHTDASLAQLELAVQAGLTHFTHLANGCPRSLDRHDNIIQRVLSLSDRLTCTLIADGVHLPWFVLKNLLNSFGPERTILISDATAAAGMPPGQYRLGRKVIETSSGGASRQVGTSDYLAGSATLLPDAVDRLREHLRLDHQIIEQFTLTNPRRVLTPG